MVASFGLAAERSVKIVVLMNQADREHSLYQREEGDVRGFYKLALFIFFFFFNKESKVRATAS